MESGSGPEGKPQLYLETFNSCGVSTSSVPDDRVTSILNKFRNLNLNGEFSQLELSANEREVLSCLDIIERKDRELARERRKLSNVLRIIHEMRHQGLVLQHSSGPKASGGSSNNCLLGKTSDSHGDSERQENVDYVVSNSSKGISLEHQNANCSANSQENQYMVSSSQEISMEFKSPVSPSEYFSNDSQPHSLQGERCTSTSERKRLLFQNTKESSDSDEEDEEGKKYDMDTTEHQQYRLAQTCFSNRNRLNSGSLSDEPQEEKLKKTQNSANSLLANDVNSNRNCFVDNTTAMRMKKEPLIVDSSQVELKKAEEKDTEDLDFSHTQEEASLVKEEHEHLCNLTPNRKGSLAGSPQSPKMRNSSGSEHGYSLRSRGPPSDSFDFNSDSQPSKDTVISSHEDQVDVSEEKQQEQQRQQPLNHENKHDESQADDELEEVDARCDARSSSSSRYSDDSLKKRKRKRKTHYHINKCRKKKDVRSICHGGKQVNCSSSSNLEELKKEMNTDGGQRDESKKNVNFPSLALSEENFKIPPTHLAAVLDIKVR